MVLGLSWTSQRAATMALPLGAASRTAKEKVGRPEYLSEPATLEC